mgnify:CR=1 FL=1
MDMEDMDRITLDNKEQMDIMTDPFALEIISAMDHDKVATKKDIAEDLGEDLKLIGEYFDRMVETGFMVIDDEKSTEDQTYYKMAARSLASSDDMMYSKEMKDFWISGFMNFLENSMVDFFNYMEDVDGEKTQHLEEIGYNKKIWSDFTPVYLSAEEAGEIQKMIKDYILDRVDKERKEDDKYKPYYLFTFLFPNIKRFKGEDSK